MGKKILIFLIILLSGTGIFLYRVYPEQTIQTAQRAVQTVKNTCTGIKERKQRAAKYKLEITNVNKIKGTSYRKADYQLKSNMGFADADYILDISTGQHEYQSVCEKKEENILSGTIIYLDSDTLKDYTLVAKRTGYDIKQKELVTKSMLVTDGELKENKSTDRVPETEDQLPSVLFATKITDSADNAMYIYLSGMQGYQKCSYYLYDKDGNTVKGTEKKLDYLESKGASVATVEFGVLKPGEYTLSVSASETAYTYSLFMKQQITIQIP